MGERLDTSFAAMGLLVRGNPLGRTMGNVYLKIARPGIPTRIFAQEPKALAWLRESKKVTRQAGAAAPTGPPASKIARALEAMIGGDLERQLPISPAGDELDAICYSVNILVGELAFATANLRRAQAEAEAANAAKSSFLRAASHELRTPLAVIVWLAELLKDPARVPPERFARSLAGIRRSADELLRTTEAVLDLSRLDDPNDEPNRKRRTSLATVARSAGEPAAARRTEAARACGWRSSPACPRR